MTELRQNASWRNERCSPSLFPAAPRADAAGQRSAASHPLAVPSCRAVLTVDGMRRQCGGSTCACLCS
eukprot:74271-Chlamydomonas_euryale.AAC.1